MIKTYTLILPNNVNLYKNKTCLIFSTNINKNFLIHIPLGINLTKVNYKLILSTNTNLEMLNTFYSIIKNLLKSFNKLHTFRLFLKGIGFRVYDDTSTINLKIGFSHMCNYTKKKFINYTISKNSYIDLTSELKDKLCYEGVLLSQLKSSDIYKGKGIYAKGWNIRTKLGKKS